jgi:RNA polymerase sigma-70 factor (ECF subfamily)
MVGRSASAAIGRDEARDDEALVAAARVDLAEFAQLYRRYVDPVFRYCYRRLGDRAAAEDATSLTFERALAAMPAYTKGPFSAWIFTIARNIVVDLHRAKRPQHSLDDAMHVIDRRPAEEAALRRADADRLYELLDRLTTDQRQIVELRLAGLTDREIAAVLGRSHGSVRTVQYRALQRLRALMNEAEGNHAIPRA